MLQIILMLCTLSDIDICEKNQRICIFMIKKEEEKIGEHTCIF